MLSRIMAWVRGDHLPIGPVASRLLSMLDHEDKWWMPIHNTLSWRGSDEAIDIWVQVTPTCLGFALRIGNREYNGLNRLEAQLIEDKATAVAKKKKKPDTINEEEAIRLLAFAQERLYK